MDWRNLAVLFLLPAIAYLLTREFSRKDKTEEVVTKLAEAVIALKEAVKGLEKFNGTHERNVETLQKELRDCRLNCPLRGGEK